MMNIEQRMVAALRRNDDVEPSPDLWSRVVHSIEEDRQHRRRVRLTSVAIAAASIVLTAMGAAMLRDGEFGWFVHRPTLELLEVGTLIGLVVVLGPAIRRFGRGYVEDLWPAGSDTPVALLRLLDLAYYLVFAGYILMSTEFEFGDDRSADLVAGQVQEALARVGGLLLIVGLLHAATLMTLPIVALIDNSTRTSRPLPRWLTVGLVLGGVGGALFVTLQVVLVIGGLS